MLNLQLAVLRAEPRFERLRHQVMEIAGMLEEKDAIPMVRAQMALVLDLQTDEWWQDVTVPMLESARRRIRDLVQLIEKARRKPLYTDFADEMGGETSIVLPGFGAGSDTNSYARDLGELERILVENRVGAAEDVRRAATESQGLGLFVRSLVGLDRAAAKSALAGFVGGTFNASQIEFVNLIVDHLTEHGVMEASRLYESPFTDVTPHGPDALFNSNQLDQLIRSLDAVRASAIAA